MPASEGFEVEPVPPPEKMEEPIPNLDPPSPLALRAMPLKPPALGAATLLFTLSPA